MWTKQQQDVESVKTYIGWAYDELKWLTDEQARRALRERAQILKPLEGKGINLGFRESKIYSGELSPGCLTCGQGTWSCIFINGLCTANCFFCPQDRKMKQERPPDADGVTFDNPDHYVDYLKKFKLQGVGFSGGESLLVFEKLLLYIEKIRQRFRNKTYLWIYTNGDLVDADKLRRLKKAGLNEIRFNISANNYSLKPVELAKRFIPAVTVEIPAIPEDYEILKKCILRLEQLGVNYLNIHQLCTTRYNYKNFIKRDYSFLHLPGIPILQSEISALKLIKYALNNNIKLPINYCCEVYKNRFQSWGRRKRAACFVREAFETETAAGYIRRLSVQDRPQNIKRIMRILKENNCEQRLHSLDNTQTELFIHPALLKYINLAQGNLIVSYFEAQLKANHSSDGDYKEIKLNANRRCFVKKELVAQIKELSLTGRESFQKLFIENMKEKEAFKYFYQNYDLKTKEGINRMKKEAEILMGLKTWEDLGMGLPRIY